MDRRTLVQVYQTSYKDGSAKGLGDFLRGYGCLIQLGEKLGFDVEVDLRNHPIAKHLAVPSSTTVVVDYAATTVCPHINYVAEPDWTIRRDKTFIDKFSFWMQSVSGDLSVVPVFVTAYPIARYSTSVRERVLACTIPTPLVLGRFVSTSPPRPYSTLHVRTGDSVIVEKTGVPPAVEDAMRKVTQVMEIGDLLLSDTRCFDRIAREEYGFHTTSTEPIHLGDSPVEDIESSCLGTLYDWWLLSHSSSIVSLSVYFWGSGFSTQASVLNGIPLQQYVMWPPSDYALYKVDANSQGTLASGYA